MTLTTQTWRVAGPYTVRTDTLTNRITDIKDAFVTNGADSNGLWINDGFDASTSYKYLTVKRKGSPGGTLGTFRACIFGTDNTNTISYPNNFIHAYDGTHRNDGAIYIGHGTNISTTAPTLTNFTTTDMWTRSTTKWSGGAPLTGALATGGVGQTTTMYIVECDRMVALVFVSTTQMAWAVTGECVENLADNTGIWATFGSGGEYGTGLIANTASYSTAGHATASPFPLFNNLGGPTTSPAGTRPMGAWLDGTDAQFDVGRISCGVTHGVTGAALLEIGGNGVICPLLIGGKTIATNGATNNYGLIGLARQIRMGPMATGGIKRMFNGVPALRGYIATPNSATSTQGVVFDNSP